MSQSTFNLNLPTADNAGNPLTAGQLTAVVVVVTSGSPSTSTPYSYTLPAGTPVGASVAISFAALGFSAVGGTTYAADAYAVDANGNGISTAPITWTEDTVPAAPTGFSVS